MAACVFLCHALVDRICSPQAHQTLYNKLPNALTRQETVRCPIPRPKTRRGTTSVRATARAGPTSTAQTGIICGRGRIAANAAAQGQKPAPKLNSSFTTHQHVQTQSRTHEGPHLVREQSNTPASFSCSRGGTHTALTDTVQNRHFHTAYT